MSERLKGCKLCQYIPVDKNAFDVWVTLVRFALKDLEKEFDKTEEDIKAIQSVGQIIGEVLKQLDDERCEYSDIVTSTLLPTQCFNTRLVIVKASSGPRYVVSFRPTLPLDKLKPGTRVSLDMTTLTIMRILPREVDPLVYNMSLEDPGGATFAGIGGLGEQVRELREVCFHNYHHTRGLLFQLFLRIAHYAIRKDDRTSPHEPRTFPTGWH